MKIPISRRFLSLFFIAISSTLLPPATALQAQSSWFDPSGLVHTLEARNSGWTDLSAELTLQFLTHTGQQGFCRARLFYDRLYEKLLLQGYNNKNELLFALKASDRQFELYLSDLNTIYYGDMFDLETRDDLDAFISPLDFYRALKIAAVSPSQTKILSREPKAVTFAVKGKNRHVTYNARSLTMNTKGDVLIERYFHFNGTPQTTIERGHFKDVEVPSAYKNQKIAYPFMIVILKNAGQEDTKSEKRTKLLFKRVDFNHSLSGEDWDSAFPQEAVRTPVGEDVWRTAQKSAQASPATP